LTAVRSAYASVPDPGLIRLIIVDNGSTDESLVVFDRELPNAHVIPLPENRGFAAAANAGLRVVAEPFAFLLNTDLEFRNDVLGLLAGELAGQDRAVLACPRLLRPDGSEQAAAVPEPTLLFELTNRSLARHLMHVPREETSVVPGVVGPCMAVHMERLRKVGFLDERFFFFFEETDWCKRMSDAGCDVLFVPSAEAVHLQGESANRRPTRARVQFYDSRYRYFRKHAGKAAVATLFLGLWLKLTISVVLHSLLSLLTLGGQRHVDRVVVYVVLWTWHVLLCRPRWGFDSRR